MVDLRLYDTDAFVLLEANQPEQILTADELRDRLRSVLKDHADDIPAEVQDYDTIPEQIEYLIDNLCELNLGPDLYFQWYAVRLEK
ncbi:MAG: chlororespiratory reduction protein 7 [Cyanobacteria bacterium P01_F01_bin.150]